MPILHVERLCLACGCKAGVHRLTLAGQFNSIDTPLAAQQRPSKAPCMHTQQQHTMCTHPAYQDGTGYARVLSLHITRETT